MEFIRKQIRNYCGKLLLASDSKRIKISVYPFLLLLLLLYSPLSQIYVKMKLLYNIQDFTDTVPIQQKRL